MGVVACDAFVLQLWRYIHDMLVVVDVDGVAAAVIDAIYI